VKISGRLAEKLAKSEQGGVIWANQFDNVANRDGHIVTTAEEIWRQTDGKVDGFVSAVGTGGTLAGVAAGLRSRKRDVKIAIADPMGAALHSYYTTGELKSEGSSITASSLIFPIRSQTMRRCRSSSISCRRKACASEAQAASTSPGRSGWRASLAPATRS
jgi:cysteine synthase